MEVVPHVLFRGQCEEAFRFYADALRGQIVTMLTYGDSPMAERVPPQWRNKIIHASLTLAGGALTGADVLPEQYRRPQGFYVLLGVDGPAEAERIFVSLADKGVVGMPLQETFWSARFGVVVDRFGIPWEISCRQAAPREQRRPADRARDGTSESGLVRPKKGGSRRSSGRRVRGS
jgi:PhnB protein